MVGPERRELVDAIRKQPRVGILAGVLVLLSDRQRLHDRMGRRSRQLRIRRPAHLHADGQRPLPGGRLRQGRLLPQHSGSPNCDLKF